MKSPLEKLIEDVARRVLGRVHERTAGVNRSAYATPLNEAPNLNDPIIMSLRAAADNRKQSLAAQKDRMAKRVSGRERARLEERLWSIMQDLRYTYADRRRVYDEMNSEAGQMGDAWTDKEANRYGAQLEKIDRKIEKLIVARQAIETQLAY